MDKNFLDNLKLMLVITPEKDWYKVLANTPGEEERVIALTDIIGVEEGSKVFYQDFIQHLKDNNVDLGFSLGRASKKVAALLSEEFGIDVKSNRDSNKGMYLTNISLGFIEVKPKMSRPYEINKIIVEAKEERYQSFIDKGFSPEKATYMAMGMSDLMLQIRKEDHENLKALKKEALSIRDGLLSKVPERSGRLTIDKTGLAAPLLRAVILLNDQFRPLIDTELFIRTDMGKFRPDHFIIRALGNDSDYSRYLICEYNNITFDDLHKLLDDYSVDRIKSELKLYVAVWGSNPLTYINGLLDYSKHRNRFDKHKQLKHFYNSDWGKYLEECNTNQNNFLLEEKSQEYLPGEIL